MDEEQIKKLILEFVAPVIEGMQESMLKLDKKASHLQSQVTQSAMEISYLKEQLKAAQISEETKTLLTDLKSYVINATNKIKALEGRVQGLETKETYGSRG